MLAVLGVLENNSIVALPFAFVFACACIISAPVTTHSTSKPSAERLTPGYETDRVVIITSPTKPEPDISRLNLGWIPFTFKSYFANGKSSERIAISESPSLFVFISKNVLYSSFEIIRFSGTSNTDSLFETSVTWISSFAYTGFPAESSTCNTESVVVSGNVDSAYDKLKEVGSVVWVSILNVDAKSEPLISNEVWPTLFDLAVSNA